MRRRDLLLLNLPGGDSLLIACDAAGGIGPKPHDTIHVPAYTLGRFSARVVLMEVIAAGGCPVALVDNCCVEPSPTGEELLRGVRDEAALVGVPSDAITGSFEKNIPVAQTALGVTAIAVAGRPAGQTQPGDLIVAVGRPKAGNEVHLEDPEIADLPLVHRLARDPAIHDILPVGSRGIAAEVAEMAPAAELLPPEPGWDLAKSAGPATCVLMAVAPSTLPALALVLSCPWTLVAQVPAH